MMTAREQIEARIKSGEPFTFSDVWVPVCNGDHHHDAYRLADRTIQQWRRKGLIRINGRRGSSPLWELVTPSHGREGTE